MNDEYGAADRRLECLKLAQAAESVQYSGHPINATTLLTLQRAKEYADFVNGPAAEALSAATTAPGHLRDAEDTAL